MPVCTYLLTKAVIRAGTWNTKRERKWTDVSEPSRLHFCRQAARLANRHPGVTFHAIVVYKPNVAAHIRSDANKLYNYMLKLLLVDEMRAQDRVQFVPDNRSVKVESGNSLHDYLQTTLWFEAGARTELVTTSTDSKQCLGLQFADFMAGAVGASFEHGKSQYLATEGVDVRIHRLYFPKDGGHARGGCHAMTETA
jgi:hypothetical protein